MMSSKTMSSWLSRVQRRRVALDDKAAFLSPLTTRVVSNVEHSRLPKTVRQSRREFLWTASGMAVAFLGLNRVYGRVFEVHKPETVASGQIAFDNVPLDVARFAAEHWNPMMLEELCLGQKRFK